MRRMLAWLFAALLSLPLAASPAVADLTGDGYLMKGRILTTYQAAGGEAALGLPVGVESHSTTYKSYYQRTTDGRVWWSRADGGKAVPDAKTVRLKGARGNFRDVAGEVSDGLTMRRGIIYRSADLDTTTAMDRYILQTLGVTVDVMLNGGSDPTISGITKVSAKMTAGSGDGRYETFVTSATQRAAIKKALTAIATAKGAVVIHCAAGKDRTGWVSAVLQMVAGVPLDQIRREYLKSGWKTYGGQSVKQVWLDRAITKLYDKYDGVEGYLLDGIGLSQGTYDKLVAKVSE